MAFAEASPPAPSTRLSVSAVCGAALSVGSIAVCLIAALAALVINPLAASLVLALPFISAAGAVLSIVALRRIERSRGSLEGRPLAVAGLVAGIAATLLQGAVAAGAVVTAFSVRAHIVPLADRFLHAGAAGDMRALRATLSQSANRSLTDDDARRFFAELDRRLGTPHTAEFNLGVMLRAASVVRRASASAAPGQTITENPKPVELIFDRGRTLALILPDEQEMQAYGRPATADVIVFLPGDGVLILLIDGPGAALARRMGWQRHAPP